MELNKDQNNALQIAVRRFKERKSYTSIAGYAGTGKTTLVKYIIEELGLEDDFDDKETFDLEDENIGANWLGNIDEEKVPTWEEEIVSPISENDISPDDWGFSSDENIDISASDESSMTEYVSEDVNTDGEGEEWVWEYVEDESSVANSNYNNDNLEPILQQSAVCSGDLYYQNPSFDGVSISASISESPIAYNLSITDSAESEISDDPYQKNVIKN